MRWLVRLCLPVLAGAMSAMILFTGWVTRGQHPFTPIPVETLTITISPEGATYIRQQAAAREQAHPFLSRYTTTVCIGIG